MAAGGEVEGAIGKEKWRAEEHEDAEIEAFKRDIDLRQFAVSLGYEVDPGESWRGSTVLRRDADKIVVKRKGNGHYVFFSVRDDWDNGTIIDFLQGRKSLSLGGVRKALRAWIGKPSLPQFSRLEPSNQSRLRVEEAYGRMVTAPRHPYLEQERGVPAVVLSSQRFADRVRVDGRGNAVFPHFDRGGLCGYEIKNRGFTGFAVGGEKGLWFSRTRAEDRRLVLAESAIDALSYASLFPDADDRSRYASLGGKPTAKQSELLKATIGKLTEGSEIVAAFDADPAGRLLVKTVRQALPAANVKRILKVHLPSEEGKDWNDVLQSLACRKKGAAST
jgi:hypothetical protein